MGQVKGIFRKAFWTSGTSYLSFCCKNWWCRKLHFKQFPSFSVLGLVT